LGIASGDDNFCQRILALHTSNRRSRILVGGICHCTGVQDYEVGLSRGGAGETSSVELEFQGSAVGLGGAASEIFNVVGGHGMNHDYRSAWAPDVPDPARAWTTFLVDCGDVAIRLRRRSFSA
jgi:hypothetical protein